MPPTSNPPPVDLFAESLRLLKEARARLDDAAAPRYLAGKLDHVSCLLAAAEVALRALREPESHGNRRTLGRLLDDAPLQHSAMEYAQRRLSGRDGNLAELHAAALAYGLAVVEDAGASSPALRGARDEARQRAVAWALRRS